VSNATAAGSSAGGCLCKRDAPAGRRGRSGARRRGCAAAAVALAVALGAGSAVAAGGDDPTRAARERMVTEQIEARGISDAAVLAAMRRVPRHELVPRSERAHAYEDRPLPIGHGQTISQPFVVGWMTALAHVRPGARVLEVGTGSGYQAAVLAAIGAKVWTIEIVDPLARRAARDLARLGYTGVQVRSGDGYRGWPEAAPFDAILVTAAAPRVPPALLEQLRVGGRLVMPVGESGEDQVLQVHERTATGFVVHDEAPVRFVPMTGAVREAPGTP
jgi:protein-L-isoaspartate(D-aspartate) O-methyltransferase